VVMRGAAANNPLSCRTSTVWKLRLSIADQEARPEETAKEDAWGTIYRRESWSFCSHAWREGRNNGSPSCRTSEFLERKSERTENILHVRDPLVSIFSNRLRLRQSPWEDWLKHVVKNNEGEGREFCNRVCPQSQEKAAKKG